MPISLSQIKKLRDLTKAGIMDCRTALEESKGNLEKAKKWLADKGILTAQKKKDRTTKAGLIEAYLHNGSEIGSLIKLTCETDFVARTADFKKLAHELVMQVAAMEPKSVEDLLKQPYIREPEKKISDLLTEMVVKTGENIKIESIARLEV